VFGFPWRLKPLIDVAKFMLLGAVLIYLITLATQRAGYYWQWYRIPRYLFTVTDDGLRLGPLLTGLFVTLKITAVSMFLAFAFGLICVLMRLSGSFCARALSRVYLELIRNTPLLIQIFLIYFVIAPIFDMGSFSSAVIALSLFEGAYISEILRAGILSVPKGQWEAGYSLGLRESDVYMHVVGPQAVKNMLPGLTGQAVSLIKDSALVSTIAIYDLTMQGQAIVAETFLAFEIWFVVALIYLAMTLSLSSVMHVMEKRMGRSSA